MVFSEVSPAAFGVVVGMSVATYTTKAAGFWLLDQFDPSDTTREALDALPGGIVVAIVAVRLTEGGLPEWFAGLVVVAVADRTDNILFAMAAGLVVLLGLRNAPV